MTVMRHTWLFMMPIQVKFCRPNEGEKYEPVFYNKCTSHVSESKNIYLHTWNGTDTVYERNCFYPLKRGFCESAGCFSVVSSSGFIILFYLLCVIGGGLSYCEDCNSGFTRYAVVRGDAKKYIRGHLFLQPLAAVQACLAVWHCMNCS